MLKNTLIIILLLSSPFVSAQDEDKTTRTHTVITVEKKQALTFQEYLVMPKTEKRILRIANDESKFITDEKKDNIRKTIVLNPVNALTLEEYKTAKKVIKRKVLVNDSMSNNPDIEISNKKNITLQPKKALTREEYLNLKKVKKRVIRN